LWRIHGIARNLSNRADSRKSCYIPPDFDPREQLMKTHVRGKVLVLAALLAAAACGSKDSGGVPASAKGAMALLPGDADMYVGMDFASMRSSGLYKQYAPMIMAAAAKDLAKLKDACGIDPLEKVGTVVAAIKGDTSAPDVTATMTGFTKDELYNCVQKQAAADGTTVKVDGDYLESTKDDTTTGMLAVGDQFLIHVKPHGKTSKDELVQMSKIAADKSAAGSASLQTLLGKVNSGATIWFALKGDSAIAKDAPLKFKVGAASIKITDGLEADLQATMSSEAEAKELADKAKEQMEPAKSMGFLESFSADASGADIHIKASISGEQLKKLVEQFGGMFGGMGGRHHGGMDE
jgi:hypothetical protein